jgi:hypothetical protein
MEINKPQPKPQTKKKWSFYRPTMALDFHWLVEELYDNKNRGCVTNLE